MYQQLEAVKRSPPSSSLMERLIDVLSGDEAGFGPEEIFLLEYSGLVAQFRLAVIQKKENLSLLIRAIDLKGGVGEMLGFSQEELSFLNVFFRDRYRYGVENGIAEDKLKEFIRAIAEKLERLRRLGEES